jgi:hypothetical protein
MYQGRRCQDPDVWEGRPHEEDSAVHVAAVARGLWWRAAGGEEPGHRSSWPAGPRWTPRNVAPFYAKDPGLEFFYIAPLKYSGRGELEKASSMWWGVEVDQDQPRRASGYAE